jgi:hypothetical protein
MWRYPTLSASETLPSAPFVTVHFTYAFSTSPGLACQVPKPIWGKLTAPLTEFLL